MGTFVQGLVASLSSSAQAIAEEKQQKEKVLASMDKLLADFNESKKQDAESQAKVKALQEEVAKLKSLRVKDFVHPADRAGLASVLSAASGAAGLSGLDAAKKFYEEEQSRKDAISAWLKFKN